jgi:ribosomal protein S18 acetylase RimI-like enzyme
MPSTVVPSVSTAVFVDGTTSRRHYVHVARSDQPTVRVARESDLAAVLELWAAARSVHARTPDTREVVERLLTRDPGSLLLAELEGRIVGALIATWDGWRGNRYRLAVLSEHRRRGIGLLLVREGERRLVAMGARRISALVGRDDEAVAALWIAAGYDRDELIGRFVKNV